MNIQGHQLKPSSELGSGRVRRFVLPDGKISITQITTFCPDLVGPGPTHLYLIETDVLILVDTGIPTGLAKSLFYHWRSQPIPPEVENLPPDLSERQLLEGMRLAKRSLKDLDVLVISHGHPDHYLLGHSILGQGNPKVVAHLFDTSEICNPWGMLRSWLSRRPQMTAMGVPPPPKKSETLVQAVNPETFRFSLPLDSPIVGAGPLQVNGSEIKGIQVTHLPGHSPGSIGLIVGNGEGERVLLCGDVLLNPITPHPSDLLEYLRTLEDLKNTEHIPLVLPAHGMAIRDLKARVSFIQLHHRHRLQLTYEACKVPRSVWEIATMPKYFDVFVDPELFNPMASTEALVHIEILKMAGAVDCSHMKEGVHYFQNSGKPFEEVYGRVLELVADRRVTGVSQY